MTPTWCFDAWMAERPLAYWSLVAVTGLVVIVIFVDLPLAIYLRNSSFSLLRPALDSIGELGRATGWVVGALLLYGACLWARHRDPGRHGDWFAWIGRHCLLLLASLAATGIVIHLLKALLGRSRPSVFFSEGIYGFGWIAEGSPMNSFPSGHTQVAVTVAAVLALALPSLRLPIFAAAALVGLSRMVNGAHYLSDVVASAFICLVIVQGLAKVVLDRRRTWLDLPPHLWLRRRSDRSG